jgi:hypothetical protein
LKNNSKIIQKRIDSVKQCLFYPNNGADGWIQSMQAEQIQDGYNVPMDKIDDYVTAWEQLEYEVLDRLVQIEANA